MKSSRLKLTLQECTRGRSRGVVDVSESHLIQHLGGRMAAVVPFPQGVRATAWLGAAVSREANIFESPAGSNQLLRRHLSNILIPDVVKAV